MTNPAPPPLDLWSFDSLKQLFSHANDVIVRAHRFGEDERSDVYFVFSEGTCDSSVIGNYVLASLTDTYDKHHGFPIRGNFLISSLSVIPQKDEPTLESISVRIFQGELLIIFPTERALYWIDISRLPQRSPDESNTELSIKGPRDGFVENVTTNIALIRKRIRSSSLYCEMFTIGRRTSTKIALMYFYDIAPSELLDTVRKRLEKIDVDGVQSIQQIEELISDHRYAILPLMDFTGRPDFTVSALLKGRFVILVDGNPMVLIGPSTLSLQLKSPEDLHFPYLYTSFARTVRYASLFLTILLPGVWVSLVAFHQDQIPFRLLATIAVARLGLPFAPQFELFLLLLLLEIFREAGSRLPSAIGSTLTVVGGLIIGDAAIRAGLVSPSSVVVGAVTAVSSATLINQNISVSVSILRLSLFILCCFLGMYGLILGSILLVYYLSRLTSFGKPYLMPLSPIVLKDMLPALFEMPWAAMKRRPAMLRTKDDDQRKDDPQ
jgi:spore germination protein KA